MDRAHAERLGALFLLLLSFAYLLLAFRIPLPPSSGDSPLTARSLPLALGVIGMGLSLVLIVRPPVREGGFGIGEARWDRLFALLGLMGLYALAIPHLGFAVTSAAFLAAGFFVLGERRPIVLFPVAIVTAFAFWAAFYALDVRLDWGVFGRMIG